MESSAVISSFMTVDRPYDDYAFVNLCATKQIDNLTSLQQVERRYTLSADDCVRYREELDRAQGSPASSNSSDWRFRIARWILKASDELMVARETALIALSYCDRFLLRKTVTRHSMQVAAMASLFVATKLYEKRPVKLNTLMTYTQFKFERGEIVSTEEEMVRSIGNHLYPPTAGSFVLMLLNEFFSTSGFQLTTALIETCQFAIELSSCAHKQSNLAKASIIVTSEEMQLKLPPGLAQTNFSEDKDLLACVKKLRQIYSHNEERIKEIDGQGSSCSSCTIDTIEEQNRKRAVARAATPSPTPEVSTPIHANSFRPVGENEEEQDDSPRKKQRVEI